MPDLELEAWREQWQADAEVPADLRLKVARGTRNMRLMLGLEGLVTVVISGGYTIWAAVDRSTEMLVLAAEVWVFTAALWTVAFLTRRRTWSPSAMTTADFVDLSIRRCRGKLVSLRFSVWLYFAQVIFSLTWLYRVPARRVPAPAIVYGVVTPIFLAGVAHFRRKTRAELASLLELSRLS
jgi:hypothetical protein